MIFLGTVVNALGVLLGGGVGLAIHKLLHKGIPQRYSQRIMQGIGLCTVAIAAGGILSGDNTLITILSMVLGAIIGEWLDLDGKIGAFSNRLQEKFSKDGSSDFAQGFLAATLLFCVGTMAILGSFDSGLKNDHATLYAKTVMDTISACIFASTLGLGVLFSAGSVLVYQGSLTLLAALAGPVLTDPMIQQMNAVGSLLLLGLSLDLLGIQKLKLMNYLPAMFLAPLFCLFL